MNHLLTSLLLCLLYCNISTAQSFGVKLVTGLDRTYRYEEVNVNGFITFNGEPAGPEAKLNLRYGADLIIAFNKTLSISAGLRIANQSYYASKLTGLRWPSEFVNGEFIDNPNLPDEVFQVNTFNMLEFPVSIRYSKPIKENALWLEGGLSYNYLRSSRSYFQFESSLEENLVNVFPDNLNKHNLSFQFQLGYSCKLSNNIYLEPGVVYRQYLTPIINSSTWKENLFNIGFECGLSYNFNNEQNKANADSKF